MWCSLWSPVINCCTLRDVSSAIGTARGLSSFPCSCMLSNWICPSFFANKVWDGAQIKFASEENDEKSSSSFRLAVIWGYLSSLKLGNGTHKFGRINDAAKTVLILPHSNAGEESCVSYKENKTAFRQHLSRWTVRWPFCLLSKWPTKSHLLNHLQICWPLQRKLLGTTTKSIINAVFQRYGILIWLLDRSEC